MTESVYKVIELVGTSTDSWEKAATAAVELAAKSFATSAWPKWSNKIVIEDGKVRAFRSR